jgi:hypothetical protein
MISYDVQELVDNFDLECESKLNFNQIMNNGKKIVDYIDELITKTDRWDFIAVSCRKMIICDRKLNLKLGSKILKKTYLEFLKVDPKEEPYEAIKFMNVCGLIHYRSGNNPEALDFFENANKIAKDVKIMEFFIPDTESNIIRTKFEIFYKTMPNEISSDYAKEL